MDMILLILGGLMGIALVLSIVFLIIYMVKENKSYATACLTAAIITLFLLLLFIFCAICSIAVEFAIMH